MSDFSINEMLDMQKRLQDKYRDKWKWEKLSPEAGKHKLLWMIGEIGEVIDIVKKNGDIKAPNDAELRKDLVEEMADVLMYYNEILLCYGISADELKQAYTAKFEKNMTRW
ncbi:MAG: nucleotide pyrophosphohydrolase [Lachnospiraceae bacterium]|nr:nucleotide pyrophosphohydrolase [Lachnospiraceae bacterium]